MIQPRAIKCTKCKLGEKSSFVNRTCIGGKGKVRSPVWVVGEAPGQDEARFGIPFVGRAGKLLDACLSDVKKKSQDYYVQPFTTNVVRCRPPKNRNPYVSEINACLPYLLEDIIKGKPRVIIAVGNIALKTLTGNSKISGYRGSILHLTDKIRAELATMADGFDDYDPLVIPSFHPAGVLRNPHWIYYLYKDIDKGMYSNAINATHDISEGDYIELEGLDDLETVLGDVSSHDIFSFDIETTGLRAQTARILCMSFSYAPEEAFVYMLPTKLKPNYKNRLTQILEDFFCGSKRRIVGQNIKYDFAFLKYHFDIDVPIINVALDTMLAHHLLEENAPAHSLNALIVEYTNMGIYDAAVAPFKDRMEQLSKDELLLYSAKDADGTRRCAIRMLEELEDKPRLRKVHDEIALPLSYITMGMELRGVEVDVDRARKMTATFKRQRADVLSKIESIVGSSNFNPSSNKQVSDFLHNKLRAKVQKETDSGNPSIDEEALNLTIEWAKNYYKSGRTRGTVEFCESLLALRKLNKTLNTYLFGKEDKGMLSKMIDNRLHTSYHVSGTSSGRLSSSDPNLQNVPPDIRQLIVPREGHVFIEVDYDRIEMWVLAYVTQDKELLRAYSTNADLHMLTATKIFNLPESEITKEQRSAAKSGNFGVVYGIGPQGLMRFLKISHQEAEDIIDGIEAAYPGIKKWKARVKKEIRQNECLITPFGRERHFPGFNLLDDRLGGELLLSGGNSTIQSPASDILSKATIRLDVRLPEYSHIVLSQHDELAVETPTDTAIKVSRLVKEVFEEPVAEMNAMVFPCEVRITNCWHGDDITMHLAGTKKRKRKPKFPLTP